MLLSLTEKSDIHSNNIIQQTNESDLIESNDSDGSNSNDGLFTVDDLYSSDVVQQSELHLLKFRV